MQTIPIFSLVFILFSSSFVFGWKFQTLVSSPFEQIFPYSRKADIQKLVDALNDCELDSAQKTWKTQLTEFAKLKMNLPANSTQKLKKENYAEPSDEPYLIQVTPQQAFSLERAFNFTRHRVVVNRYIRYLYRSCLILDYFDQKQADTMRDIFWAADKTCENDFDCTESEFFEQVGEKFSVDYYYVKSDLNRFCNAVRGIPTISKYLYISQVFV